MLQPDNDNVDLDNGLHTKKSSMNTTFTITATGPGGTASGSVNVYVYQKQPGVFHMVSPMPGELIQRPDTLVQGIIDREAFTGDDIGVVVNGVVAHVYGNWFAANHAPLQEGDNSTITAHAFNDAGDNATDSITVRADTSGNYITLSGNPESGIVSGVAPLEFTLSLTKTYTSQGYSFSYSPDNGSIENRGDNGTTMQFKRRVAEPGLYYITVEDNETLDNGTRILHTDTIAIMADNRTALDTKLQVKWGKMVEGFANQNIEQSLKYISILSNDKYRDAFNQLLPQFQTIAATFQGSPIELIYVHDNIAKYSMDKNEIIEGQTVPITFFIYFIKDMDGLWKIDKY